jgi:formate dehydrogenase iron-sulfur subunit
VATETCFTGTYENPPDLEPNTFTRVTFREVEEGGKLYWLFRKDQCRHCVDPPCALAADPTPMSQKDNGAVVADQGKKMTADEAQGVRDVCPYDIPRFNAETETIKKCTFCFDRQEMGLKPACVTACLSGTLFFGTRDEVMAEAKKRLETVKAKYPKASLVGDETSWIYLLCQEEDKYGIKFDPAKARRTANV